MAKSSKSSRTPAGVMDERVLDSLARMGRPASAYELLESLKEFGVTGPPTVYRALKRLQAAGRVHRLESLNAFVACSDAHCHDVPPAFAICRECGSAKEFSSEAATAELAAWARQAGFRVSNSVIELHGRCEKCATEDKTGLGSRS